MKEDHSRENESRDRGTEVQRGPGAWGLSLVGLPFSWSSGVFPLFNKKSKHPFTEAGLLLYSTATMLRCRSIATLFTARVNGTTKV